jgi:hypothetical protein
MRRNDLVLLSLSALLAMLAFPLAGRSAPPLMTPASRAIFFRNSLRSIMSSSSMLENPDIQFEVVAP